MWAHSLTRGRVCRLSESQSAVISLLSVCAIYILYVIKCMYVYTTYTGPLSVQAQYSRSCPIISSSCYNSSLVTWTRWTELGRTSHIASERTHRERRLQHLFYCCVTSPRACLPSRPIATAVRVTYRDNFSIVVCRHYLATAVSLAPQFLFWANTSHYGYEPSGFIK
jgi:hypothetical protein